MSKVEIPNGYYQLSINDIIEGGDIYYSWVYNIWRELPSNLIGFTCSITSTTCYRKNKYTKKGNLIL